MVFGTYIPPAEKQRIARAVRWTERVTNPNKDRSGKRRPMWVPQLGITDDDIDNGASGSVFLCTGTVGTETATTDTVTASNVINGMVISGTFVMLSPYGCAGRDPDTPPWIITPMPLSYQAKAQSVIAPGDSGTVDIYKDGAALDPVVSVTAYFDWIASVDNIDPAHEIIIKWFIPEQKWRIVNAECP